MPTDRSSSCRPHRHDHTRFAAVDALARRPLRGPRPGRRSAIGDVVSDALVLVDDHIVLACTPGEAMACLHSPAAIAAWFGAQRHGARTTIHSPAGQLTLDRDHERWEPADSVLTVDGRAGPVRIHAHLTVRAVIRRDAHHHLHRGTEVWVHAELAPASQAQRVSAIIRQVILRGLEHLRLELDTHSSP